MATDQEKLNAEQQRAAIELANANRQYFNTQSEATEDQAAITAAQAAQVFQNSQNYEGELAWKQDLIRPAIQKRSDIKTLFSRDDVLANLDSNQILIINEYKALASLANEMGYEDFECELLLEAQSLLLLTRSENMKQQDKLITTRVETNRARAEGLKQDGSYNPQVKR